MHLLRIIIAAWIFGSLILAAGYCGMLKAAMMSPALTNPINTLQDLLESGLRPEMAEVAEYEGAISTNQDPLVKALYDTRIEIEFQIEPKVSMKFMFLRSVYYFLKNIQNFFPTFSHLCLYTLRHQVISQAL